MLATFWPLPHHYEVILFYPMLTGEPDNSAQTQRSRVNSSCTGTKRWSRMNFSLLKLIIFSIFVTVTESEVTQELFSNAFLMTYPRWEGGIGCGLSTLTHLRMFHCSLEPGFVCTLPMANRVKQWPFTILHCSNVSFPICIWSFPKSFE